MEVSLKTVGSCGTENENVGYKSDVKLKGYFPNQQRALNYNTMNQAFLPSVFDGPHCPNCFHEENIHQ